MGLAALKGGQTAQGAGGPGVLVGRGRQGDEHLVAVQPGVCGAQILYLDGLNGLDGALGDEMDAVAPGAGEGLQGR